MKKIILYLFIIFGITPYCFAANNATDIYLLAQTKSATELNKVENIDVIDADGNTALCSAIKDNNVDAYNLLKSAGANTGHQCVKKIPTEQYKAFTQKLVTTSKSWSFLGLGKWVWTAIGAGVVAGGAAAAMGGGGSSGSGDSGIADNTNKCDGYIASCDTGYKVVDTCQSGNTTMVKCEFDDTNYFKDPTDNQIYDKLNCVHGTQSGNTCNCIEGWAELVCNTAVICPPNYKPECTGGYELAGTEPCQSGDSVLVGCQEIQCGAHAIWSELGCNCEQGYQNWTYGVGCSLVPLTCGSNAHQEGTQCVCEQGYRNWQSDVGCELTPLSCGSNAHQEGTQCVCESGYQNWQYGVGCELTPLSCGSNAHQEDTQCVCESGYQNWPSGIGCSLIPLTCGNNAHQDGTQCVCESGYQNWQSGVGCSLIPINCNNGTQNGTACSCNEGWTGAVCDTAVDCGDGYQLEPCSYAEIETNTCQSGNNTLVMCTLNDVLYIEQNGQIYNRLNCDHGHQDANICVCDTGYTETLCDTFDYEHYFMEPDGSIYLNMHCVNGAQVEDRCSCNEGWTDDTCNTPVPCASNYRQSCTGGYESAGAGTCQSGNSILVECQPIECSAHATWSESGCDCEQGYENWQSGVGCEPVPINCNHGIQNGTTCSCDNGWTGAVCDTLVTCEYQTTSCTGGYEETGNICQSGNTLYKECRHIQCGAHTNWSESGCSCESGYQNYTPGVGCYPVSCGVNATQLGTECYCNPGYQDWENGYGCHKTLSCGVNASQVGDECVCNPGSQNWTQGYGCYVTLNCGVNATQSGNSCVCNSGYTNWEYGYGCHEILNCGAHAKQVYGKCICDSGYQNWTNGVGCEPIPLNCGVNAIQNGTHCECVEGFSNWQQGIGCYLYGIYSTSEVRNNSYSQINLINNSGDNFYEIYGIKAKEAYNLYRSDTTVAPGTSLINIQNQGNNDIYGINVITEGKNSYVLYDKSTNYTGEVRINNTGDGNIYGLYGNVINAEAYATGGSGSSQVVSNGNVNITNKGNGNVYGMYNGPKNTSVTTSLALDAQTGEFSYVMNTATAVANGTITIQNTGEGDVYGMYGTNIENAHVEVGYSPHIRTKGVINISNTGNGNVYGMYGTKVVNANSYYKPAYKDLGYDDYNVAGQITITNDGTGNAYGMYTDYTYGTLTSIGYLGFNSRDTYIKIINKNSGKAYGMYNGGTSGKSTNGNRYANTDTNNTTHIIMQNILNGTTIGMYANGGTATNEGTIHVDNVDNGTAIGILGDNNAHIYNSEFPDNHGIISINNIGTGTAIGIFGGENSHIENHGTINITRESCTISETTYTPTSTPATNVFGIYIKSGGYVYNRGVINITSNGGMFGIYAETGATVQNTGTITLNDVSCNSATCSGSSTYIPYIVLNGSSLLNKGIMSAPQMNLNSMGGKVVAGLGSQFVVDNELSGDLNISSDIVMDGNQTTYVANNMIDAGDISKLNVRSASAMFNAKIADNKHDIVMQMKDFNELTENASLAQFLADNYAKGNGNDLFVALKSLENMSAFNGALAGLTGLDTFTQFAHEDLSAMREISFSMNNKLFENSSRDSFDISDSMGYFSFSDSHNGGNGRYGISNDKITDNLKLGYGMAMANINTNDGHGMNRQNKMWLFYMPLTYTDEGYELVIAPKAGFANSEYNRRGYNNMNYEGYIEKRIFGLMNDLRYPLTFGNWTIAPDLAFNAIVYDQSGHEQEQEFSLIIPDDRTVSVETGLGFYTKYEKTLQDGSRFKLNSGFMVYHEFGDTYDIKLGMRGMDGTFSLYNNDYEYRGAANIGFDYMAGRFHLYGNAQYFMDNDNYMNVKGGVSYRF